MTATPSYGTASALAAAGREVDPVGRRMEERHPALGREKRPPAAGEPGLFRRSMAGTAVLALFVFAVATASYRRQMPTGGASGPPAAATGATFVQVGGGLWRDAPYVDGPTAVCLGVRLLKVRETIILL